MIAGFEVPDGGQILLDGRDISRLSPAERGIGMVFQNYALFPHLTVGQNVAYGLRVRRIGRREAAAKTEEMLELVRLEGYNNRLPHELSGGQQQRVAMARAMAFGPSLMLMDEPLGALDRELRLEMEAELRQIHRDSGATIVYVTHDQEEALALSDKIAILRDGRLIAYDTAEAVFEKPASAFGARFLSRCNVVEGLLLDTPSPDGYAVRLLGTACKLPGVPLSTDNPLTFAIPRTAFSLEAKNGVRVSCRVDSTIYRGDSYDISATSNSGDRLAMRLSAAEGRILAVQDEIVVSVSLDAIHALTD
jgi:putative spermidine/putrescine transport system ATP-binding protein